MFERFTKAAREVVLDAVKAAERLGQRQVGPEHLLLGLVTAGHEVGAQVLAGFGLDAAQVERAITRRDPRHVLSEAELTALRAVGIDAEEVFRRIEEAFGEPDWFVPDATERPERRLFGGRVGRSGIGRRGGRGRGVRFGKEAKQTLEQSLRQAIGLKHRYIGSEHILLGLLALPQPPLPGLLAAHGITYELARQRVLEALRAAA
jgi:ATP-dependent Clp protease ATP-binding subunit ClpA